MRWSIVSLWVSTTREDSWILLALSACSFDRLNIVLLDVFRDLSGSYLIGCMHAEVYTGWCSGRVGDRSFV